MAIRLVSRSYGSTGFGGSGADWKYIFKEVPAGYRLIAPDMRGHGASTGTDSNYSFRQAARDVGILLDELKVSRTKAVGLSGRGITLLHLATQQPQRVDAMVVISALPYFPPQVRAIKRQYSAAMIGDVEMARMRERHRGGNEQIDWIIAQTRTMAETYDDVNFTPPLLGTVTARTLIVFGDIDPLYPISLALSYEPLFHARRSGWCRTADTAPSSALMHRSSSRQPQLFCAATGTRGSARLRRHCAGRWAIEAWGRRRSITGKGCRSFGVRLFMSQRYHRINFHRPSGRNPAR